MEIEVSSLDPVESNSYRHRNNCPYQDKVFSYHDLVNYWLKDSPTFDSDYWNKEYYYSISTMEWYFFQWLISEPLKQSISRLDSVLSIGPHHRFIQAYILGELIRQKESSEYLDTVSWGGDGYFFVSNSEAHKRIQVLIELVKSFQPQSPTTPSRDSIDQLFADLRLPTSQKEILSKDLLMWARIPIFMWGLKFDRAFERIAYFKFLGKLHSHEIGDQADSNISSAVKDGSYHEKIHELIKFLNKYVNAYNEYHNNKSKGSKKVKDQLLIKLKNFGLS